MSAQADLGNFFIDNGIVVLNQTVFWDYEGDLPDDTDPNAPPKMQLIGYRGFKPIYVYNQRTPVIDFPRVQISCYSKDFEAAESLAEQAYALSSQSNIDLFGTFYTMIRPVYTPESMGLDANSRHIVGFSVETRRRG